METVRVLFSALYKSDILVIFFVKFITVAAHVYKTRKIYDSFPGCFVLLPENASILFLRTCGPYIPSLFLCINKEYARRGWNDGRKNKM